MCAGAGWVAVRVGGAGSTRHARAAVTEGLYHARRFTCFPNHREASFRENKNLQERAQQEPFF